MLSRTLIYMSENKKRNLPVFVFKIYTLSHISYKSLRRHRNIITFIISMWIQHMSCFQKNKYYIYLEFQILVSKYYLKNVYLFLLSKLQYSASGGTELMANSSMMRQCFSLPYLINSRVLTCQWHKLYYLLNVNNFPLCTRKRNRLSGSIPRFKP